MDFDGDPTPYAEAIWNWSPQGFPNQKMNALEAVVGALGKLHITATDPPKGAVMAPLTVKVSAAKDSAIQSANKAHANKMTAGHISLLIVGEAHPQPGQGYGPDQVRASMLLNAVDTAAIAPTLVVLERGLPYNTVGLRVRPVKEESICRTRYINFNQTLSIPVRSVVVAGFIFWALAATKDQRTNEFVIAFFGEEHKDIIDTFEYLCSAKDKTGVDWLDRRPRSYCVMRSLS